MAVRLACPRMAMIVAPVPLTWYHPFARLVPSSWVCASHWPSGAPQEPDDNAEDDEGQGSERQYGERPGNGDPTLQRLGEEPEALDEEGTDTSDVFVERVDGEVSLGECPLFPVRASAPKATETMVLAPSFVWSCYHD